jgi:hypothetical protein
MVILEFDGVSIIFQLHVSWPSVYFFLWRKLDLMQVTDKFITMLYRVHLTTITQRKSLIYIYCNIHVTVVYSGYQPEELAT